MEFPKMCPARWLSDENFGMCIPPHDFMYPFFDMSPNYYRPWKWYQQSISKESASTIENEKGNYKITLDVQHFRPNEIYVKVKDNEIIVEGNHEERPDTHGFITRQFKRRYPLPSHCPAENVTSTLSSDGILTIIAEKMASKDTEKIVPIKMCGSCPRKGQIETKITSDISEKVQKESVKAAEDIQINNKNQIMLKEDHSRLLLKPELLKGIVCETNGTNEHKTTGKEIRNIPITSEKTDPLNIGGTTNKIEESIEKSIMGLTVLNEQLGKSLASTSDKCSLKSASEICGKKDLSDTCTKKEASATGDMKDTLEMSGIKSTSESCATKRASEKCSMKGTSEICNMKDIGEMRKMTGASDIHGISKTIIEESASSFKSSSMTTSTRIGEKAMETVSDMITAELKEAAENV